MNVAVTGATGHVGTNLCRMLLDRGHKVKALVHKNSLGLESLPLELVKGDISDTGDLSRLCSGCEVVFHLAACITIRKKDQRCMEVNAESCTRLIDAAIASGVKRIIHFSSIHAFVQHPSDIELNETRPLALGSKVSYDHSKALGQKIMMAASGADIEVIVLNPTAIIGPNDFRPSLLGNALIRFFQGQNPSLIPGGYNWVDVRDVCNAAINAIDKGTPGECYLIGGHWQSLKSLAEEIEKNGGKKVPALSLPLWLAWLGAVFLNLHARLTKSVPLYTSVTLETLNHSHRNISSEKAARELSYSARPFSETIADTVKWFRNNKYI